MTSSFQIAFQFVLLEGQVAFAPIPLHLPLICFQLQEPYSCSERYDMKSDLFVRFFLLPMVNITCELNIYVILSQRHHHLLYE